MEPAERIFTPPRELRGTAVARQGFLPDLEPLLASSGSGLELGRSLIPRSRSSPDCSPPPVAIPSFTRSPDHHSIHAGVCLAAAPLPKITPGRLTASYHHLWGTVCSMCSATLGAGALSLPYAFEQLGIVGGIASLVTTAAASHYSVVLLTSAIARTGARSYEELTVAVFGRTMGVFVELNIIAFCFGSAIAYTVALGDLTHPLLAPLLTRKQAMALCWAVVMLPLSLVERISALRGASTFGVLSVCYLVLSVAVHAILCGLRTLPSASWSAAAMGAPSLAAASAGGAGGAEHAIFGLGYATATDGAAHGRIGAGSVVEIVTSGIEIETDALDASATLWWTWRPQSLEALAIFMFAFTCQVNVPSLYDELEDRSLPRMHAVSARAILICFGCYVCVGVAGYLETPDSASNLLSNYCVDPSAAPAHSSRLMLPAYVAMALSLSMAYPLNIHPCRYTLDILFFRHAAPRSVLRHFAWTVSIAGAGLLVSLYVPAINIVFQLMGSTSSAFVCFVLPAAFGLRLNLPEARGASGGLAAWLLLIGGATLSAVATASTVSSLVGDAYSDGGDVAPPVPQHVRACHRTCHI